MIGRALENLGVKGYILSGEPENEQEFNSMFKIMIGEDEYGSAIMSDDPKDFGVTWAQIRAEVLSIQTELSNTEYQRLRAKEYPDFKDYLDGIVKGDQAQIQSYIDACLAVKAKYPKP